MNLTSTNSIVYNLFSGITDLANMWLERFQTEGRNLYLFGAGSAGLCFSYTFQQYGISVTAFCDNNPQKVGTVFHGLPVVSFEEMKQDHNKFVVISAVNAFDVLIRQCETAGIPADDICSIDWLWFDKDDKELILNRIDDFVSAYSHCSDDLSKQVFTTALINRYMRDRRIYKNNMCDGIMYFDNDILHLRQGQEVFLDCGAAFGDTATQFLSLFGGKVYAYEPDDLEYQKLLHTVKGNPDIITVHAGLGDAVCTRRFNNSSFDIGGTFEEGGNQAAQVQTIDLSLSEVPTFIKMDIQGYELNALQGAEETIRQHKPKMAICIYHKTSHFFDIPNYIFSLRPDYKMYVRHYRDDVGDTICYFI